MMISSLLSSPRIDWQRKYRARYARTKVDILRSFYQQSLPPPSCPLKEITFLAVDFETTGLDQANDEIITIGVVPFTLDRIYLNQAKHWLVKPRKVLNESSVVIHGITHSDIRGAPDLNQFIAEILTTMQGRVMVAHYHMIERYFFDREVRERLGEGVEFPIIDTMQLEQVVVEKNYGGLLNRLKGKRKPSVRLGACRSRYGLPIYPPHHALIDAIATAELMQAQIGYHFDEKKPISQFWL
jgi:DNA polymerase-3 subunit epsilon